MTTFIADPEPGIRLPPPPGFVQRTVRERLAEAFDPEGEYFVYEGRPYIVFGMWDYAEDWSAYPIREVHPFAPHWRGTKVTEAEFRAVVRAMHAIGE